MNDAQSWTLIAGFLAIGSTMAAMTLRMVQLEIRSLRHEMEGRFSGVDVRIDALDQRLSGKIDALDRDVQTVINRLMGN